MSENNEQENTNKLMAFIDEHPKAVFWTRFSLWTLFACVLPFTFIVWRFKLFQAISQIQIGGWGIIAFVIVAVFLITIARYVKLALSTKYSMLAQCLGGFCKVVVPLLVFLLILNAVKSNVDLFIQVMGVVTLCETTAIPINPLPKWAYERQKNVRDEERKDTMDYLLDGFFRRKKDNEGGGH